ncbi:hypothetical protein LIA77_04059 [Sarocladium implicatum]|nr:hypothetical protein LIA77_04059 [Sarocladium implicatum]
MRLALAVRDAPLQPGSNGSCLGLPRPRSPQNFCQADKGCFQSSGQTGTRCYPTQIRPSEQGLRTLALSRVSAVAAFTHPEYAESRSTASLSQFMSLGIDSDYTRHGRSLPIAFHTLASCAVGDRTEYVSLQHHGYDRTILTISLGCYLEVPKLPTSRGWEKQHEAGVPVASLWLRRNGSQPQIRDAHTFSASQPKGQDIGGSVFPGVHSAPFRCWLLRALCRVLPRRQSALLLIKVAHLAYCYGRNQSAHNMIYRLRGGFSSQSPSASPSTLPAGTDFATRSASQVRYARHSQWPETIRTRPPTCKSHYDALFFLLTLKPAGGTRALPLSLTSGSLSNVWFVPSVNERRCLLLDRSPSQLTTCLFAPSCAQTPCLLIRLGLVVFRSVASRVETY